MTNPQTFTAPTPLNTAVLFLVFNRPHVTAQVFKVIRQVKPPRLYVSADGPRADRVGETERCAKVREIATAVDWPCEVKTLFREKNLGCKSAVSDAITWFFEQEEQGIILEDDCLPSQSFFWFCEEMLERYKTDERIFIVSGYNKQGSWRRDKADYFFSYFGGIWGWASWRRAWKFYDGEMTSLESMCENNAFTKRMGRKLGPLRQKQMILAKKNNQAGVFNSWAYPWALSRLANNGLACVTSISLVQNIGFGEGATHTDSQNKDAVIEQEISFPLRDNNKLIPDLHYDLLFIGNAGFLRRLYRQIQRLLKKLRK